MTMILAAIASTLDAAPVAAAMALAVLVGMAWRRAHGNGAKALARVETAPVEELPQGRPAEPAGPVERRRNGTLTPAGARHLGRRGAEATNRKARLATQLADNLGLANVGPELAPYVEACADFARAKIADLAANIGGGELGPGPASIVQSAALALAASRWAYAKASETGDPALFATAARLGDQSRQALLTAHELAAREAQARPRQNPLARFREELAAESAALDAQGTSTVPALAAAPQPEAPQPEEPQPEEPQP